MKNSIALEPKLYSCTNALFSYGYAQSLVVGFKPSFPIV